MRAGTKVALWAMAAVGAMATGAMGQVIAETEPNGTVAQADAVAPVTARTLIRGAITPTGDMDVFKVVVTSAGAWRFEVFDPTGADCASSLIPAAVRLAVLDAAGVAIKTDAGSAGIGLCPEVTWHFDVGTYYVRVDKITSGTIAEYLLDCRPLTNAGTETEPNETAPTATPLIATTGYIFGGHLTIADSDFYSFAVTAGASVRLEVIEGDTETCEANSVDSFLTLFSPAGVQLVTDDDGGRGFCSMIDGAGASPLHLGAHNLSAGTYTAQVKASTFATGADGQFNYRLVVMVYTGVAACCATTGECTLTAPGTCAGTIQASVGACSPNPCAVPAGACCNVGTGGCAITEAAACATLGGQFRGGSTTCVPNQCVAGTGACCTGTACAQATSAACAGAGQVFQGVGSACVAKVTCCPANFNRNTGLEIQDIFDFLNAWFAGCP